MLDRLYRLIPAMLLISAVAGVVWFGLAVSPGIALLLLAGAVFVSVLTVGALVIGGERRARRIAPLAEAMKEQATRNADLETRVNREFARITNQFTDTDLHFLRSLGQGGDR